MNPRKWKPPGFKIKLINVAMKPVNVAVPSFLTHQTANINEAKPTRSQRKGRLKNLKKIGETKEFSMPHNVAKNTIHVMSRVPKYGKSTARSNTFSGHSNTYI